MFKLNSAKWDSMTCQGFCTAIRSFSWQFWNNLPKKSSKIGKTKAFFKIPKLSWYMKWDQNCDLWNFLHSGYRFLLSKYFQNLWELIKNRPKMFTRHIYVQVTLSQSCLWPFCERIFLFPVWLLVRIMDQ